MCLCHKNYIIFCICVLLNNCILNCFLEGCLVWGKRSMYQGRKNTRERTSYTLSINYMFIIYEVHNMMLNNGNSVIEIDMYKLST